MSIGLLQTRFPVAGPGRLGHPWFFAQEAERLGFESLWAGEHMVVPRQTGDSNDYHLDGVPRTPATLVRLAGVAAATTTIKVGTSVILAPQHHPVLLAKELATLDADSGGRLIAGMGIGWNRDEGTIMGANWDRRVAQFREVIEVVRALWTGQFVEYHGEFFDLPPVASLPGPVQQPRPPILIGVNDPKGVDRAAAYGDGWQPGITDSDLIVGGGIDYIARGRERLDALCEKAGRDPASVPITVILADDRVGHSIDRALIERYRRAGAERVILLGLLTPDTSFSSDAEAVRWMEALARRVLD